MSLTFKEGIKIPPPALNEIILASNQDIRQVKKTKYQKSHFILRSRLFSPPFVSPLTTLAVFSPGDPQPEHVVGQRQGDVVRPVQV